MIDLSVVIVSYNTESLTLQTLNSLCAALDNSHISWEVIVVDNGSTDNSVARVRELALTISHITIVQNEKNAGFGAANNIGVRQAAGEYVLLLNSDTIVDHVNFDEVIGYMRANDRVGIYTVKLLLPDGTIDPACHRGFPTLWRSVSYFSRLEKMTVNTPLSKTFGGYHLTHMDLNTAHEIESPSGAFFIMPRRIYDAVQGFDETFFMYGEDLDLAYRVKQLGYMVWYDPSQSIVHIKGQSGRAHTSETKKSTTQKYFYDAMKIFYSKHYESVYPAGINKLVYWYLNRKINSL